MNTPSVATSLIPSWWFVWMVAVVIGSFILSGITALIATARGLQPLTKPSQQQVPAVDAYGYPTGGVAVLTAAPSKTQTALAHPFLLWLTWLFGSFAGYVALGMVVGAIIEVIHLAGKYLG